MKAAKKTNYSETRGRMAATGGEFAAGDVKRSKTGTNGGEDYDGTCKRDSERGKQIKGGCL